MNNTRFATAVHILTILADKPDEWMRSDYIAGSINVNPVVVRRELRYLHDAGLVISRKGKEGGTRLSKSGEEITMKDIYLAVKNSEVLGKKNQHTSPRCPIGKQINTELEDIYSEVNQAVMTSLKKRKLSDFVNQFQ